MSWLLLLIFVLMLILFGIISLVLLYHWHRYARASRVVAVFELVYLVGGAVLLLLAGGLLVLIFHLI